MRIQKGNPRFTKREVWNLTDHLSKVIYVGLVQFKESKRHGFPMLIIDQYLSEVLNQTEDEIKLMWETNPNGKYDTEAVSEYWEQNLDIMIFAFNKKAHKDYSDIEECPILNSLLEPEEFDSKLLEPNEKGLVSVLTKPKQGFTQEDVDAYFDRLNTYEKDLQDKIHKGLDLFSKYFQDLWD